MKNAKIVMTTLLAMLMSVSVLAGQGIEWTKISDDANFIHGNDIIDACEFRSASTDVVTEKVSLEDSLEAMKTVMVTSSGEVFEGEMNPEDLAIFEEGIRMLSKSGYGEGSLSAPGNQPQDAMRRGVRGSSDEECVFGADGRTQITTTTVNPYYYIGRVAVGCTGTLVGPKHVLTAGHCVSNGSGGWYSSLDFAVAQDGSYYPWGTESWTNAYTTSNYHNGGDSRYDYGMIILADAPHGGWAGYGTYSSGTHSVGGYPGDKPFGTMWNMGGSTSSDTYKIYYSFDTAGGQSGSGIRDSGNVVRGIHAYCYSSNNGGTRMTSTVFNTVKGWVAAHP